MASEKSGYYPPAAPAQYNAPPMGAAEAPPSYDQSQNLSKDPPMGAGGFQAPQHPNAVPSGQMPLPLQQQQPQQVLVQYVAAAQFGPDPMQMTCPRCEAQIRTTIDTEPGVMAWIIAGVLCFTGFWCCACIPCCVDSLQDVQHSCPACKQRIGTYKPHNL